MPAKNKTELLEVTHKEYGKLDEILLSLSDAQAATKQDDISIKDIVGHRAHWIDLFLGWYADGQAGKPVFFPAEGYKWNELPRYNADLREKQKELDWEGAKALLEASHQKLVALLEGLSEDKLYGGPMKGARNAWTPGRWAEAAGPSHYRSASKYIRSALKGAS
ncbi:ClbS/DfsB family four-helix bundle protein [Hoeflea prorocentri]|uniref:ClbS/DfsB family four-helix bundle protein n=1 Tax=Hoeflea prorocentri TaxID=1922333 RepID=A0A9X3UEN7_9HYPH|nr:ClbS/DfsB family four-helix bundle protein [Hoeflea prorocentri]MCY6380013.1 ClbS/DfsB family four-helix bundle protein [Hoeflea prorocentri]MDA5397813.1 ClbS/DfsB family four-helix bundle protein [Hoeflea prorocentri]